MTRLNKPAQPDAFGLGDSPVGFILCAWQGPLLVRLHILPAGAEQQPEAVMADWGWGVVATRDDKRATSLIKTALFLQDKWTGHFPGDLAMGFHGSDFQWSVMTAMLRTGSGKTLSYGQLAAAAKTPKAARAAGSVCARNPLPLIVPCHRVLAGTGSLGNYGYGTALKRQFLDWER